MIIGPVVHVSMQNYFNQIDSNTLFLLKKIGFCSHNNYTKKWKSLFKNVKKRFIERYINMERLSDKTDKTTNNIVFMLYYMAFSIFRPISSVNYV